MRTTVRSVVTTIEFRTPSDTGPTGTTACQGRRNVPVASRTASPSTTSPSATRSARPESSDQPAAALLSLARSWLNAPAVTNVSGGTCQGYNQSHRAYGFQCAKTPLRFQIAADERHPIHNLCFEIRNWKGRTSKAKLKINRVAQTVGLDLRQGVNTDTDGTYTLIVWVGLSTNTPQHFEIAEQ